MSTNTRVVNPQYREIDGEVRNSLNHLNWKRKEFGALILQEPIEPAAVTKYELKKAELQEAIAISRCLIDTDAVRRLAEPLAKNRYGQYLLRMLEEQVF